MLQGVVQESGRSWSQCRAWRRSPAGAGYCAGGDVGVRQGLDTVKEVTLESGRRSSWVSWHYTAPHWVSWYCTAPHQPPLPVTCRRTQCRWILCCCRLQGGRL